MRSACIIIPVVFVMNSDVFDHRVSIDELPRLVGDSGAARCRLAELLPRVTPRELLALERNTDENDLFLGNTDEDSARAASD